MACEFTTVILEEITKLNFFTVLIGSSLGYFLAHLFVELLGILGVIFRYFLSWKENKSK